MQLEIIIPSKSEREKQIPYDITHMWNLKNMTQINLPTKLEQTRVDLENRLVVAKGGGGEEGRGWTGSFGLAGANDHI